MIDELRHLHQQRIERLRELSVDVLELSAEQTLGALSKFAAEFLGEARAASFMREVQTAQVSHREVDYGRWLWAGAPPPALVPRVGWLSDWLPGMTCIRFDRRVSLPALCLGTYRMLDEWALCWPGVYVCFDTWRAMVVSLDYEVSCYDLRAHDMPDYKSPYR